MENNGLDYEKGVIVDPSVEKILGELQKEGGAAPESLKEDTYIDLDTPLGYSSKDGSVMGHLFNTSNDTHDSANNPEVETAMLSRITSDAVKRSSSRKVIVLNLNSAEAYSKYESIYKNPLIRVISETGNFCTVKETSQESVVEDQVYKVVITYIEIDRERIIAILKTRCRANVLTPDMARSMLCKISYEFETESGALIELFSKEYSEGEVEINLRKKVERQKKEAELQEKNKKEKTSKE